MADDLHDAGDDLAKRLRDVGLTCTSKAADRIEQLEAALTRANAATAAAYELAANVASFRHDENQILRATWATPKLTGLDDVSEEIRALATPDQTAALDAVRAEARAQGMREAAAYHAMEIDRLNQQVVENNAYIEREGVAGDHGGNSFCRDAQLVHSLSRTAILAAIKGAKA